MTRPTRRLTDQVARHLVLDTEPWLSCDDCFALMDVYVETVLERAGGRAMPEMAVHLAGCPACAEETQSLLDLISTDSPPPDTAGDQRPRGPGSGRERSSGELPDP